MNAALSYAKRTKVIALSAVAVTLLAAAIGGVAVLGSNSSITDAEASAATWTQQVTAAQEAVTAKQAAITATQADLAEVKQMIAAHSADSTYIGTHLGNDLRALPRLQRELTDAEGAVSAAVDFEQAALTNVDDAKSGSQGTLVIAAVVVAVLAFITLLLFMASWKANALVALRPPFGSAPIVG